ncbi:hypothetical protein SAY86_026929 [Trapa natans]|uniref:Uncharacterized protein n=1 Tax=Trapa natans TaxID=22666 RepID=A0AAN7KPU2_TRANT|nr:hypothetical protein SAY86_026929 [Trapa natans]
MKSNRAAALTVADKCRNILAANWQCHLSTIKADAKGSKEEIHTSKVNYMVKRGKPYLWISEDDAHNVNTIIDERGSLAVTTPFPGPLPRLLKSVKMLPSRIALTGDVILLKDKKAQVASQKLEELIHSEQKTVGEFSYTVRGILSSANPAVTSRSENLLGLTNSHENYNIYKFDLRSCTYVSSNGVTHEVALKDLQTSKADSIAPYTAMLIDGINQSESRRRALVLLCFTNLNAHVRVNSRRT